MPSSASPDALYQDWLVAHRGIVMKVTRSFAPAPADAADLQQEILLQLWFSTRAYAGAARPSTWVYRVALNTALTWRRGATRRERHHAPAVDPAAVPTPAASPAENAADRELLEKLYAAIHALPPFDRALVLLSLDGVPYREMAEVTGLTENHVGVALTRARQRLAHQLKDLTDELE